MNEPPSKLVLPPNGETDLGPEVRWDKQSPQGPPQPIERNISEPMKPIVAWLTGVVADEAVLLDLCLEKAIKIVDENYQRGAVGMDLMGETFNRTALISIATPLAVKLYSEVLGAVEKRRGEPGGLDELVKKIQS